MIFLNTQKIPAKSILLLFLLSWFCFFPPLLNAQILLTDKTETLTKVLPKNSTVPEETLQLEGIYAIEQYDDFDNAKSYTEQKLYLPNGTTLKLHLSDPDLSRLVNGQEIKTTGTKVNNDFFVNTIDSIQKVAPRTKEAPAEEKNRELTELKTLVLMFNFLNTDVSLPNPQHVQDYLFEELNNYYLENSYGTLGLTGVQDIGKKVDMLGWFTIDMEQSCNDIAGTAYNAVHEIYPEINFQDYDRVILIAPYAEPDGSLCAWSGMANYGAINQSTPDGIAYFAAIKVNVLRTSSIQVFGHEMGHTLSIDHANFYDSDDFIDIDTDYSREYEDIYSIMGHFSIKGHFNAAEKERVGFLSENKVQVADSDGLYTIYPLSDQQDDVKLLKVQRTHNSYLYLEYRQPIGFDSILNYGEAFEGALAYIWKPNDDGGTYYDDTLLIDTSSPPLSDAYSTAILEGQTFVDPASMNAITVISKSPTELAVDVQIGKTDYTLPSVSLTAPESGNSLSEVVTLKAEASDESGISSVRFNVYRGDNLVWSQTDEAAPYQVDFDTTILTNGSVTIQAVASDTAGEATGALNNENVSQLTVTINNQMPDIVVESPIQYGYTTNPVSISFEVIPNDYPIAKVQLFKNNNSIMLAELPPDTSFNLEETYTIGLTMENLTIRVFIDEQQYVEKRLDFQVVNTDYLPEITPLYPDFDNPFTTLHSIDVQGDNAVWIYNDHLYRYNLATYAMTQLINNEAAQSAPAIYGTKVVYADNRNGNSDIYLYDFSTGTEQQLTTDAASQTNPDIYGNYVVYEDKREGYQNYDIFLYDLSTGTERKLTLNSKNPLNPAIYENTVVFQDKRTGATNIYAIDIATGVERQITNDLGAQTDPDISGHRIVFASTDEGSYTKHPVLYDIDTHQTKNLATSGFDPRIEGNLIVYSNGSVHLYDTNTGQSFVVTPHEATQIYPVVSSGRVLWMDNNIDKTKYTPYMADLTCLDGTTFGQCTVDQQYCWKGELSVRCDTCNQSCPADNPYCSDEGICEAKCLDGTAFDQCNLRKQYCDGGSLISRCDLCNRGCSNGYVCLQGECCRKIGGNYICGGSVDIGAEIAPQDL